MQNETIKNYLQEVKQKRGRISKLQQTIKENESRLPQLQEEYKKAVAQDKNNIDDLFHEIEGLQKQLKADKYKLETLKGVTEEHLKVSALKVLEGYNEIVTDKYDKKAAEVMEKIEKLKREYLEKVNELNGIQINRDFKDETAEYWDLITDHNIDKKELNTISNGLYSQIENVVHGQGYKPFRANHEISNKKGVADHG